MNSTSNNFYDTKFGLLLYANETILHYNDTNPSIWDNHTITRELVYFSIHTPSVNPDDLIIIIIIVIISTVGGVAAVVLLYQIRKNSKDIEKSRES
jgi:hypothetical protein